MGRGANAHGVMVRWVTGVLHFTCFDVIAVPVSRPSSSRLITFSVRRQACHLMTQSKGGGGSEGSGVRKSRKTKSPDREARCVSERESHALFLLLGPRKYISNDLHYIEWLPLSATHGSSKARRRTRSIKRN